MIQLTWVFTRSGGWHRLAVVVLSAAIVSALLQVAGTLLLLPDWPDEYLFTLISNPGTRVGAILALLLLTLPVLTLLYQGVRLGTAARERRLAGLRLAGATVRQVRVMGALEVGIGALLGSILGVPLFYLLRFWLGGTPYAAPEISGPDAPMWYPAPMVSLIPRSVALESWQLALIAVLVSALGFAIGVRASSGLTLSPLGVSRRQAQPPPRPWGFLLLLAAAQLLALLARGAYRDSELSIMIAVSLGVLGTLSLAPWLAHRIGLLAQKRARTAPGLLAARRLVDDPRTIGRAAAATGAIGLLAGGGATMLSVFLDPGYEFDGFFAGSYALAATALVAALLVASATMSIHSIETILDRRRSMSGLVALGASPRDLQRSQVLEAALVGVTSAAAGYVVGALTFLPVARPGAQGVALIVGLGVGIVAMVRLGVFASVRATTPWLNRAVSSDNLRRE